MQTWCHFREQISAWAKLQITDEQFYAYLVESTFECDSDKRVAAIFIKQHDNGEWSHPIYHRNKVS
jgi:hypothetical protein